MDYATPYGREYAMCPMSSPTSRAHAVSMGNAWFMTEHLAEDHRVALEAAADRKRLVKSTKPVDGKARHLRRQRQSRMSARGSLLHRAV